MAEYTRREWLQRNIAIAAGAGAASALPIVKSFGAEGNVAPVVSKGNIQLALMLSINQPSRLKLARQIGVNHAIVSLNQALRRSSPDKYVDALAKLKPVAANQIKLGLPGRDEEIANYCAALEAMGKVGITMCCYNFMAGLGWYRTNFESPARGDAMTSEFNYKDSEKQELTRWGRISEEKIWDNITYFLKRVIPVAEKAGVKMALHPDDPPISPLRGIGRILTSADAFRRVMDIVPSPINGITFCQANFKAMGEDLEAVAREFCEQGKVFFVHFRDIEGQGKYFRETFHDNGPTDMARMLQVYYESGFDGPIRPDHAPTLEGESGASRGYGMQGKIFAIGYMKGIIDALNISYQ